MRSIGKRIAITGGAAEGKSVVLRYVSEQGFRTISADEVVRELWSLPETRLDVSRILGLSSDFTREELRTKAFSDHSARRKLNAYFHVPVMDILGDNEAEFHEVPLLIETCCHTLYDEVWVVYSGEEAQRARLSERGLPRETVDQILSVQFPAEVRIAFAHRVIRTNSSLRDVYEQVEDCLESIS